jgi:uncharacterized protein (TIGR02646 family)
VIALERVACPVSLAVTGSAAATEREKVLTFFANPAQRDEPFPFQAYAAEDVKLALREMCGLKCAYCESDIRVGSPTDTEHFRPKAEIQIEGQGRRPGYYWLASNWENLLPSCPDCNRPRYHETIAGRRLAGKGNHFPLTDEDKRASGPGGEELEDPLLIDPCTDDPEAHLEFLSEGPIRPALDHQGAPSMRGQVTIELLGLDRLDLCAVRADQGIVVSRTIRHFQRASIRFQQSPNSVSAREELDEEIDELQRLIKASTRFAALARQMIRRELGSLDLKMPD